MAGTRIHRIFASANFPLDVEETPRWLPLLDFQAAVWISETAERLGLGFRRWPGKINRRREISEASGDAKTGGRCR